MNIILIVMEISNCLLEFNEEDYKEFSLVLDELKEQYDSKIFLSICDKTDNKEILDYFINKIKKYNDDIYFSYQFLGSTYYREPIDGAHLYTKELNNEDKIIKYSNLLYEDCDNLKMIYLSSNIDKDAFENIKCDYSIINTNYVNNTKKLINKK